MAVEAISKSARANFTLNAGTDPSTGKAIHKNITLSGLAGNPDPAKVYAIATALSPNLAYPMGDMTTTETKSIRNE